MRIGLTCLGFLVSISISAHAAELNTNFHEVTDFGTIVECVNQGGTTVNLLSVIEAGLSNQALKQFEGVTYQEKYSNFVATEIAPYSSKVATVFTNYLSNLDLKFLDGYTFPLINNETVIIPVGCNHKQLAIIGDGNKYVNKNLFDQLPPNEKAMFLAQSKAENRDLIRQLFSVAPHLLSRLSFLQSFNEDTYTIPGKFSINISGRYTIGTVNLQSNFGLINIQERSEVRLLDKGIFSIYSSNYQNLTMQGQSARAYPNYIYFHLTGEVCGAYIDYFPNGSLNLETADGDIVIFNSPGYITFNAQGKVATFPGTVTPIRDGSTMHNYCVENFN